MNFEERMKNRGNKKLDKMTYNNRKISKFFDSDNKRIKRFYWPTWLKTSLVLSSVIAVIVVSSIVISNATKFNVNAHEAVPGGSWFSGEDYSYEPVTPVIPGEDGENKEISTNTQNDSYLSLTSSTFSYPAIRLNIERGLLNSAKKSLRTEEVLNYFQYGYENETDSPLTSFIELEKSPWNEDSYLASVVVKAKESNVTNIKNNIVFLVDVSGSMREVMPLVKTSLYSLIDNLHKDDVVSMVTYASGVNTVFSGVPGNDKLKLNYEVKNLVADGATFGSGGIELAYSVANDYFIEGGNNRVILFTDGDFNIGKVRDKELENLISQKAQSGIYLTCCGYRSTFENSTMKTLADHGNGNAYFIDGEFEAEKVFIKEIGKTRDVVAKDAKCQVVFNKANVDTFRLIGYETRQISEETFNDSNADTGEIASGHTTVALYEIKLKQEMVDEFILYTRLKYKDPQTNEESSIENFKKDITVSRPVDYDFMGYVAEYCLTLGDNQYKGASSYDHLLSRINSSYINDEYRDNFISIVNKTKSLS